MSLSIAFRIAAAVAIAAAALGMAHAAEQQPGPASPAGSSTAASDASIETAKREFELLKSAREPSGQTKPVLPIISAPELGPAPVVLAPSWPTTTKKKQNGPKPANWLVDAVEKSRSGDEPRTDRQGREGPSMAANSRREDEAERSSTPEDRVTAEKDAAGLNPLAPYLAQWMTPQDYALLGARIHRTAAGGELLAGTRSERLIGIGGLVPGVPATDGGAPIAGSRSPAIAAPPVENPYLQALNTPPSVAPYRPAAPAATHVNPPASRPPVFVPPAPPATPKPAAPDFLKPQTDEKYFKPLKRF